MLPVLTYPPMYNSLIPGIRSSAITVGQNEKGAVPMSQQSRKSLPFFGMAVLSSGGIPAQLQ